MIDMNSWQVYDAVTNVCGHCALITPVTPMTSRSIHSYRIFLVMRTFEIFSLSSFQTHRPVLMITVTTPYITPKSPSRRRALRAFRGKCGNSHVHGALTQVVHFNVVYEETKNKDTIKHAQTHTHRNKPLPFSEGCAVCNVTIAF